MLLAYCRNCSALLAIRFNSRRLYRPVQCGTVRELVKVTSVFDTSNTDVIMHPTTSGLMTSCYVRSLIYEENEIIRISHKIFLDKLNLLMEMEDGIVIVNGNLLLNLSRIYRFDIFKNSYLN